MAEEILNNESQQENVDSASNYIEAIKEIKKNSVSKTEYDKLRNENQQLLNSLINGEQVTIEKPAEPVDIDTLRKDLFNPETDLSNLDFASKAIALRKALIESGEVDPFIPMGHQISPTDEDISKAQKVADALESCIEYADGNSEIFTQELQRIMVDSAPQFRFKRR